MEKSNREMKLDEIDASIRRLNVKKEQAQKVIDIANAIDRLENNPDYQLVIAETFIKQESELIMGHMTGEDHLTDDEVEAMNAAMKTIRGFRAFIKACKLEKENAQNIIKMVPKQIEDELTFRSEVQNGGVDLGDDDE